MTLRSISDTIEALRVILLKFEQALDPGYDQAALTELKRIILDRIAELESERAIELSCARRPASRLEGLEVATRGAPPNKLPLETGSAGE